MKTFTSLVLASLLAVNFTAIPALAGDQGKVDAFADRYALTISGGISLGVYEAGLNWVLVEKFRTLRDKRTDPEFESLLAVTGASAGAINSVISATRYCEGPEATSGIDDNLLRDTWVDIDFDRLLPDAAGQYDPLMLPDESGSPTVIQESLFSRKLFEPILAKLEERIRSRTFRSNCLVKVGLVVTRTIPIQLRVRANSNEFSLGMQRFVVPLVFETVEAGDGFRLRIRNDHSYASTGRADSAHLFLPERDGEIDVAVMARAALASSAFPAAFGRIKMTYCIDPMRYSVSAFDQFNDYCPEPLRQSHGYFMDGGVFDNIPLSVAVELAEPDPNNLDEEGAASDRTLTGYVYVDPSNRRGGGAGVTRIGQGAVLKEDEGSMSLKAQIHSWAPVVTTLMNQELNASINRYFRDCGDSTPSSCRNLRRRLVLTERLPNLTGNFLFHFGAFIDRDFREYDYIAGVYDGIVNVAQMDCAGTEGEDAARCIRDGARQGIDDVLKTSDEPEFSAVARRIMFGLHEYEFGAASTCPQPADNDETKTAAESVATVIRCSGDSDFKTFVKALKPYKGRFRERTSKLLDDDDALVAMLARRVLHRMEVLEEENDGGFAKEVQAVRMFVSARKTDDEGRSYWSQRSHPLNRWLFWVPDMLGFDAAQQGFALTYNLAYWPRPWILDWLPADPNLQLDTTLHLDLVEESDDQTEHYVDIEASLVWPLSGLKFSSVSMGLNINRNFEDHPSDRDVEVGTHISFGFLGDKIRLYIGTRDAIHNFDGTDWTVRVAFADLNSYICMTWPRTCR